MENCRSERSVCNKRRFLEAFRPIGKEMLDVRSLDGTQKIYKLDVLFISMSHDIIQRFNGRPVVLRLFPLLSFPIGLYPRIAFSLLTACPIAFSHRIPLSD